MSIYANVDGDKKEVVGLYGNVNGAKKEIVSLWANKDGVPVQIYGSGAGSIIKAIPKGFCLASIVNNWSQYTDNSSSSYKFYYNYGPSVVILADRRGRKIKLSKDQGTKAAYAFGGSFSTSFDNSGDKKYFATQTVSKLPSDWYTTSDLAFNSGFEIVQVASYASSRVCYVVDGNRRIARAGNSVLTGEGEVEDSFPSGLVTIMSGTKYSGQYSTAYPPSTSIRDFFNGNEYNIYPVIGNVYPGQSGDTKHNTRGRAVYFVRTKAGYVVVKGCAYNSSYYVYKNEVMVYLYSDFTSTWTLDDDHLIFESNEDVNVAGMLNVNETLDYCVIAEGLCTSSLIVFVVANGTQLVVTKLALDGSLSRKAIDVASVVEGATEVNTIRRSTNVQGSGLLVAAETSSKRFIYAIGNVDDLVEMDASKWVKVLEYDLPAKLTDPILSHSPESRQLATEMLIPISDGQFDELADSSSWVEI